MILKIKEEKKEIELRKNVEAGKCFKIIIQTYNHLIKEVEVFPEMTIDILKNIIHTIILRKNIIKIIYFLEKI